MTFYEAMLKAMTSRGMFPNQAMEIMEAYIEEDKEVSMRGRWSHDVSGYPDTFQKILWFNIKVYAYEWIALKMPEAWFRPMFQYSDSELREMIEKKNGEKLTEAASE